jgi:hypothetical protein
MRQEAVNFRTYSEGYKYNINFNQKMTQGRTPDLCRRIIFVGDTILIDKNWQPLADGIGRYIILTGRTYNKTV